MRITTLRIILLHATCYMLVTPFWASAYTFSRDLKEGDMGEDVRALQQLLNTDPQTKVATDGAGSSGQETTYFGPKTRIAVARFQERNASKILTPLGLFAGTGYVGSLTRGVLSLEVNPLSSGGLTSSEGVTAFDQTLAGLAGATTPSDTGFYVPPTNPMSLADGVTITSISPSQGAAGTKVTLTGSGFATKNDIQTNFFAIKGVTSKDGTTIVFTMNSPFSDDQRFPDVFKQNVTSFFTPVFVENENGHSNPVTFELLFE